MAEFFRDTFTDPDNTSLGDHTGESGHTWAANPGQSGTYAIHNGAAYCVVNGTHMASAVPPSADYIVEATYRYLTSLNALGIFARLDPTALTGYLFRHSGTTWQMYKTVGGVFTLLDSASATLAVQEYTIRLEVEGAVQRAYVGDVLTCDAADTEITAAGRIGIRDNTVSTTTGKHVSVISGRTFGGDSPSASRTLHPVLKIGSSHIGPLRVGERN